MSPGKAAFRSVETNSFATGLELRQNVARIDPCIGRGCEEPSLVDPL